MKYLTRVRWGGGSLLKIPFFKGQKMHKPITLILFVPTRDKVFAALPAASSPQTSMHKCTHISGPSSKSTAMIDPGTVGRPPALVALASHCC